MTQEELNHHLVISKREEFKMSIFKDNYFTNDSYSLRTERLKILQNYIQDWATQLAIPEYLILWAISAFGHWQRSLENSQKMKEQKRKLFQQQKDTDTTTFKFYLKCKKLLKSQLIENIDLQKKLGIDSYFPRKTDEKFIVIKELLVFAKTEHILATNFVEKLTELYTKSQDIHYSLKNLDSKKGEKSLALFYGDAKKLRTLYAWVLMYWEVDQPYLVQLGFAVKSSKKED